MCEFAQVTLTRGHVTLKAIMQFNCLPVKYCAYRLFSQFAIIRNVQLNPIYCMRLMLYSVQPTICAAHQQYCSIQWHHGLYCCIQGFV